MRVQRGINNTLQAVLTRGYFMTAIDGVFRVRRARDKQTRDAFQSSRLTGLTSWAGYNTTDTAVIDRRTK